MNIRAQGIARNASSTLCFPGTEKTCFACCPPIRPAGYEHIQYKNMIMRILRENTEGCPMREKEIIPITGFSCWALGYIDGSFKRVGCLLHPAQNGDLDLRYRVNYGEKCRREICAEAKVFSELGVRAQRFWLCLAEGLDSFSYSSRKINPLFKMMGWGSYLLSMVASTAHNGSSSKESFFKCYPFFSTSTLPRANAYLINGVVDKENIHILKRPSFRWEFERLSEQLSRRLTQEALNSTNDPYVHRLDLDRDFLDFLRLSPGILRATKENAEVLKGIVDEELQRFRRGVQ